MWKLFFTLLALLNAVYATSTCTANTLQTTPNGCIQFSISSGTGCAWMCSYCAGQLETSSYYFTDGVCTYQTGGCVGQPIAGKTYTCCSN